MKNPDQFEFTFEPLGSVSRRVVRHLAANTRRHSQFYNQHLQSSGWRDTRRRLIAQSQHYCDRCGRLADYLEVHHLHYRNLGYELDEDLQVLCKPCHVDADEERAEMAAMNADD